MKAPKKFDYFDPQSTLTLIQSSENTSEQDKESVNMPNDSLVSAAASATAVASIFLADFSFSRGSFSLCPVDPQAVSAQI